MGRQRRNDPAGLSDNPVFVTDPAREAELVAEFRNRLAYFRRSYEAGRIAYGDPHRHNEAIRALKRAAAGDPGRPGPIKRLPRMIEVAVSVTARTFAEERTGAADAEVTGDDIRRASAHVAERLDPIGHRPPETNLIHHVEGLMILIQGTTGQPVVPRRFRNSVDDPHFAPGASELVFTIMKDLEPSVSLGRLVRLAEKIRRSWAGRRVTFEEFFPGYRLSVRPDGSLVSKGGVAFEMIEPNTPTYFH